MKRMFSLPFKQPLSLHRSMELDLTEEHSEVSLGQIFHHTAVSVDHDKNVIRLLSGSLEVEYPAGETLHQALMFINQFMDVKGDFPPLVFRALELVHSFDKYWWSKMVSFILENLKDELLQTGLYTAVRAVQYGIPQSSHHFFAILERYNLETCTFFTLIGKMGLALHEMYEFSELVMRDIPYKEYVPSAKELHLKEDSSPLVYVTYWKVLCRFHIFTKITVWRSGGVKQMAWAKYLFNGLGDKVDRLTHLAPSTDVEIEGRISTSMSSYTTESVEGTFRLGTVFKSFYHQPKTPISNRAMLAKFLMLWLKQCSC